MADIATAGEAFTQSYAAAMELSLNPQTSIRECAEALASHYGADMQSYTFGHVTSLPGPKAPGEQSIALHAIESHLSRFEKFGLGWKIRRVRHRIEVVSPGSALCWITWAIERREEGEEGWEWQNVYGYSRDEKAGHWFMTIADNEVANLLERVPRFLDGLSL